MIRLVWLALVGSTTQAVHADSVLAFTPGDWVNAVLSAHPLVRARAEESRAAQADLLAC